MNGARSTFMRKGYWLTALAAIVLLAASPGRRQAQVDRQVRLNGLKVDVTKVTEGDVATIP